MHPVAQAPARPQVTGLRSGVLVGAEIRVSRAITALVRDVLKGGRGSHDPARTPRRTAMKTSIKTLVRLAALALFPVGTGAMSGCAGAPPEDRAEVGTSAAADIATDAADWLVDQTLSNVFGYGFSSCLSLVSGSSGTTLTTTDIANIQAAVTSAVQAQALLQYEDDTNTLLTNVAGYVRGSTPSDLANAQTMASQIHGSALTLMNDFAGVSDLRGAAMYSIVASIYLSYLKEEHDVWVLQGGYSSTVLNARISFIETEAAAIVAELDTMTSTFDARYGSVSVSMPSENGNDEAYLTQCGKNIYAAPNAYAGNVSYCSSSPEGELCGASFYAYACAGKNPQWVYDASQATASEDQAIISRETQMMTDRNTVFGQHFWQGYFRFKQIAAGNVPYLGDGTCSIGEITSGASDCSGAFATSSTFSWTTSQSAAILTSPQAELDWQSDGDLALYDTTVSPRKLIWGSDTSVATSASGTAGDQLTFQGDGNLVVYKSGSSLWSTGTAGKGATQIVLVGKTLYVTDANATVYWSSDRNAAYQNFLSITAGVNGDYVTAESDGASALIANRTAVGAWEKFRFVDESDGAIAILSNADGKYVCADDNGLSSLIANRTAVGAWETYDWIDLGNQQFALLSHANGLFVTAENAGASPLIANRTAVGPWETFSWASQ